jgi:hypothetical protein
MIFENERLMEAFFFTQFNSKCSELRSAGYGWSEAERERQSYREIVGVIRQAEANRNVQQSPWC